jgi:lysophospholipase L1-like esterase
MAGVRLPDLLTLRGGGARTPLAERTTLPGSAYRAARRYLRVLQGVLGLVAAARRRRPTEVWFGDSHAIFLNQDYTSAKLSRAPEGQIVWHLGGRLMWSLAHNGFPARVHRVARALRLIARPGSLVPVFVAGEIDVRCHLVPRSTQPGYSLDFVADYVRQARALAAEIGAPSLIIAVPVPPSDDCPKNPEYPIKGTIEERVGVFRELRRALIQAVAATGDGPEVRLVDATELLADDTGELRSELTDDGCHTNATGVRLVRTAVRGLDLVSR